MAPAFLDSLVTLIVRTSTDLPPDVRAAMRVAMDREDETRSSQALSIIGLNIDQAAEVEGAICQDTGMPTFEVHTPVGVNQVAAEAADSRGGRRGDPARQAAAQLGGLAHRRELGQQPRTGHAGHPLRAVGTRRDRGQADPQGRRLREHERPVFAAGRTAAPRPRRPRPSRACASASSHAVWQAQGKGCAPGAPSACAIGGDRASGYVHAKEQLFRTLDDVNPDQRLAALEAEIMASVNRLGVGPMGFGGQHVAHRLQDRRANRLPASFFVSVAYDCWAFRRLGVRARRDLGRDHDAGSTAIRRCRRWR